MDDSDIQKLKKLKQLLDDNLISEEDFDEEKDRILKGSPNTKKRALPKKTLAIASAVIIVAVVAVILILSIPKSTVSTSSIPRNTVLLVTLNIINSQPIATQAGFQQMIQFNPSSYASNENSDLGNIRFYYDGTELYSWCESGCTRASTSAIFWVKLPVQINADSDTQIDMAFQNLSTNYDGVYAGEAPQLSSAYAQYDNGANVFANYWNFAGTAVPAGVTLVSSGTGNFTVDDGLLGNTNGGSYYNRIRAVFTTPSTPYVLDGFLSAIGNGGTGWYSNYFGASELTDASQCGYCVASEGYWGGVGTPSPTTPTPAVFVYEVPDPSTTLLYWYGNDGVLQQQSGISGVVGTSIAGSIKSLSFSAGDGCNSGNGICAVSGTIQWARIRTYPPNGVMPTVSFSTPSSLSAPHYPKVGITIQNSQTSATGPNFQQMITVNLTNTLFQNMSSDGGNVRFYSGSTELHSWRENSTIFWVKLPNGVAADNSVSISMEFLSTGTDYDGVYAGEAPQLSSTYAQYDNGASLFVYYTNFAGTSAPANWLADAGQGGGNGQTSYNNGLTQTGGVRGAVYYTGTSTTPLVCDTYASITSSTNWAVACDDPINDWFVGIFNSATGWAALADTRTNQTTAGSGTWAVWSLAINNAGGNNNAYVNYLLVATNTGTATFGGTVYGSSTTGYMGYADSGFDTTTHTYWFRYRAYPPSGVMPLVSFSTA
jgi:hypothetical protein